MESEVSLSPENQMKLAERLNRMARLLGCRFVIATRSSFMQGTLQAKSYNLDSKDLDVVGDGARECAVFLSFLAGSLEDRL